MPYYLHLSCWDRQRWSCLPPWCVCPPGLVSEDRRWCPSVNTAPKHHKLGFIWLENVVSSSNWLYLALPSHISPGSFNLHSMHRGGIFNSSDNHKEWKELRKPSYRSWCLNMILPSKQGWERKREKKKMRHSKKHYMGMGDLDDQNQNIHRELKLCSFKENTSWLNRKWEGIDQNWTKTIFYLNTRKRVWKHFSQ